MVIRAESLVLILGIVLISLVFTSFLWTVYSENLRNEKAIEMAYYSGVRCGYASATDMLFGQTPRDCIWEGEKEAGKW